MDVTDSDHKPVRCKYGVNIAHIDRSVRREELGKIIKSNEEIRLMLGELCYVPETIVSTDNIRLENQDTHILRITNRSSKDRAVFKFICEGQTTVKEDAQGSPDYRPRGSCGLPRWLEVLSADYLGLSRLSFCYLFLGSITWFCVLLGEGDSCKLSSLQITPAAGVIKPEQSVDISVHHEEFHMLEEFVEGVPQNWWSEDTRDKEAILTLVIHGSCSTGMRSHQIRVRYCFSGKTVRTASKSTSISKKSQGGGAGGSTHRTEHRQLNSSSDGNINDHRNHHNP